MTKTRFYCPADCDPIREVAEDPTLPPRIQSLRKGWRCPTCKQTWDVEVWFNDDGTFARGQATPVLGWRERLKANWPLSLVVMIAPVSIAIWRWLS